MNSKIGTTRVWLTLAVGAMFLAFVVSVGAQVQTETSTSSGPATKQVKVERGEIVYVGDHDLVIKMEDGSLRHISNIPDSATAIVDGKEVGIKDAKVGMKLQKTITTTTTPKTITTVKTVTGKVWHVTPPNTVILTLEDGTNQQFKIPKGQKFNVDGQMLDAFGLKKGMRISATKVVEEPVTVVEHEAQVSGSMPPPPPPPPPDAPIIVAVAVPVPAPAQEAPAELPKTASQMPLIGLLGFLSLLLSIGLG